eukprot:TRINITY_DN3257_c0_g1_i4.p1 TRINITY_DN3257_c0_g1~~TRINITY_DN3257_c0_g1_i4.p1  ORF type:complete len:163 (-),score=19.37 TRINITY_DN3257_c0_g1_i4:53-508(-)
MSEGEFVKRYYDPKDRTRKIPVELSIQYIESNAYRTTYGDDPVWKHYRRNLMGYGRRIPKTRKTCIRNDRIVTASPCPICRDIYLVLDYRNVALLKQFMNDYDGTIFETEMTGLCQKTHEKLLLEIEKAKDYGLLNLDAKRVYYEDNLYKH